MDSPDIQNVQVLDKQQVYDLVEDMRKRLGIRVSTRRILKEYRRSKDTAILYHALLLSMENRTGEREQDKAGEKYWNNIYFSWNYVLCSMYEYPDKVEVVSPCADCGSPLLRIYFSSPRWTWMSLCGRAGYMLICPHCLKQLCFSLTLMN